MAIEFPKTTMTLIERMQTGSQESWTEFWKRYETAVKACIRYHIGNSKSFGGRTAIPQDNADAYVGAVFERTMKLFKTYTPENGAKFRACLQTWIKQQLDESFEIGLAGKKTPYYAHLESLEAELERSEKDGNKVSLLDRVPDTSNDDAYGEQDDQAYQRALRWNAIKDACMRHPWNPTRRKIIDGILAQKSNKEISEELGVDSQNISNVKSRLMTLAQKYLKQYEQDGVWFGNDRKMYEMNEESFMEALRWELKGWSDGCD